MKKFLIALPFVFLVGCAGTVINSPEKAVVNTSNTVTAAADTTANLLSRDRISIDNAYLVQKVIKDADSFLTLAEQNLAECREKHPRPEIGLDPCATMPELKLSQELLLKIENYLKEKEGK